MHWHVGLGWLAMARATRDQRLLATRRGGTMVAGGAEGASGAAAVVTAGVATVTNGGVPNILQLPRRRGAGFGGRPPSA